MKQKKQIVFLTLIVALLLSLIAGCGKSDQAATTTVSGETQQTNTQADQTTQAAPSQSESDTAASSSETQTKDGQTLVVAASATPHAVILEQCVPLLAEKGIKLEVREFSDYVLPNLSTEDGDTDANYFQHTPYLDHFNSERGTHLVSVGKVHYEPFGIYPGKLKSLDEVANNSIVSVPNDGTNEARALKLLEAIGWIKLKEGAGFDATVLDIVDNPRNLKIHELAAEQLPRTLADVDFAVINGNYALEAGLNAKDDALITEDTSSDAAQTYANVLVVKDGNQNNANVQALLEVLHSDTIRKFIEEKFKGSVVPIQ